MAQIPNLGPNGNTEVEYPSNDKSANSKLIAAIIFTVLSIGCFFFYYIFTGGIILGGSDGLKVLGFIIVLPISILIEGVGLGFGGMSIGFYSKFLKYKLANKKKNNTAKILMTIEIIVMIASVVMFVIMFADLVNNN